MTMNIKEIHLIEKFVKQTESETLRVMHKTYSQKLSKKTGTVFQSIQTHIDLKLSPGKVFFTLRISGGQGRAFYGTILQFGSGIYSTDNAKMKLPYFDGKSNVTFNSDRLKYKKNTGYVILKRKNGAFHSYGLKPKK